MGVKRPVQGDGCTESSFKHPKLSDTNKQLALFTGSLPSTKESVEIYSPVEPEYNKFASLFSDDDGARWPQGSALASLVDDGLEGSVPLSMYTSKGCEEDDVTEESYYPSPNPRYISYSIPWPHIQQFEEPRVILIESPQYKHVPMGPDYQAEIPIWNPIAYFSCCHDAENPGKHKFLGTSIIPGPGSPTLDEGNIEPEQVECSCLDMGSIRCHQQHIEESRERLQEKIGSMAFRDLGLCDMGEKVSQSWTCEEENLFHKVVFSYPASHGDNFWKFLDLAFPNRTKKELVNYYFNVFMLRKRAAQNRHSPAMIDSDDDEQDCAYWDSDEEVNDSKPDDFVAAERQFEDSANSSEDGHDSHVFTESFVSIPPKQYENGRSGDNHAAADNIALQRPD